MADIYEILNDLKISYIKHNHPALYTCEDAEKHYKDIKGGKSKNLFLRNSKKDKFYLIVAEASRKIDLKNLAKELNENKFSFCSPEELKEKLNLTPGSVSPFGLINDKNKEVIVIIDKELFEFDRLNYHPNINTSTLEISKDDFKKFLDWCGNEVKIVNI